MRFRSFQHWTDPAAELPEDAVDRDQLLTNVSLHTVAHSDTPWVGRPAVPRSWAVFNADPVVRRVMDPAGRVEHWSEFERGGHFPAMEVLDDLVSDIRRFFRGLRGRRQRGMEEGLMRTYDPAVGTIYVRMTREVDPYASPVTRSRTVNRLPRDYANRSPCTRLGR